MPIFLGGVVAWFVKRVQHRGQSARGGAADEAMKEVEQRGMLISSGLITGEALVGIAMAVPIVISGRSDVLAFAGVRDLVWPGILLLLLLLYGIYRASIPRRG